jgi:thioredoxin 1
MEKIKTNEFDESIKSTEYVIIDFSSPGCAPCKKVPPLLEQILEEQNNPGLKAFEVNVVEEPSIAQRFFILGVPTIIIFKNGQEIKRFNSVPKKEKILAAITG